MANSGRWTRVLLFCGLVFMEGCAKGPPDQGAPPPPQVTVAKPIQKEVVEYDFFTAQTQAVQNVDIRPRVSGYAENIPFKEGDIVKTGDLLYTIDPRPYQASYDQALGQLKQAQATKALNDANLVRADELRAKNVIAKQDYDNAVSQKNNSDAQVVSAQAAVESAKLNLDFTQVKAPIDGRVSRQLVNRGNLVQADNTILTNIVSIDPIYAYFNVDERSVLKYKEQMREAGQASAQNIPVALQLLNEQGFPHEGQVDFINNSFDSGTGTLQVRAQFDNKDGFLIPGAFGTIRVAGTPKHEAVLVADRALGADQDQKYVIVVGPDETAKYQVVQTGPLVDGLRIIRDGLKGDESIVVNGVSKVRPGSKVSPQQGEMDKFATDQLATRMTANAKQESGGAENKSEKPAASPHGK